MFTSNFQSAIWTMTQWSIFRLLKITWLRVGYRWAILGYKAKRQLESWRLLTGKAPYLLVAREGFEPPTFGL